MANGYAGKILKVDLTTRKIEEIPTSDYGEWVGGHGMGSAIFWDLCEDKTILGTDPGNVVTITTSPLSGTLAPAVSGRTEVTGIGIQAYPIGWYTRSNFGGRFSTQLKYAGWDGIAILGKSDTPVWLNIVDGNVTFEDSTELWGLDTWAAQEKIWEFVTHSGDVGDWEAMTGSRDGGRSTQRPAVLTCGPNAETFGPMAALIHDAGNGAGQGGFGGVFASKNLKAVSVLGTGGVEIADVAALMDARLWAQEYSFAGHRDNPSPFPGLATFSANPGYSAGSYPTGTLSRPQACVGCIRSCRGRTEDGVGNESSCFDHLWYRYEDRELHDGQITGATGHAVDLAQKAGVNTVALEGLVLWLESLSDLGLIGPGKEIESSLPYEKMGSNEFAELLIDAIITQKDIGADIALGLAECAKKWGRYEEDTTSGILPLQEWGIVHHYDGRTEAEWGYGSLLGERDVNEHDFNFPLYWTTTINALKGIEIMSAERIAEIFAKKLSPYNDPMMIDYSDEGIYSEAMAKTVAWHRHYTRFWKESILYCDWGWADFINAYGPDGEGLTGEGEPKFLNAVTGGDLTFEDGIEIGRRIWNLDRAIWILQGRHRDQEVYGGYMYETGAMPGSTAFELPYTLPVYEDGKWSYKNVAGRKLDRDRVEEWKTKFFELEGWDPASGWPTRATLEELDLGHVADALDAAGKLGAA